MSLYIIKILIYILLIVSFLIEFDIIFTTNIGTNLFHSKVTKNRKNYLSYYINEFRSRGYQVYNINQRTIKTISDKCNMICGD